MKVGLVLCGDLDTRSGGFLYDRELVGHLQRMGDTVRVLSIEWRSLVPSLLDNLSSGLFSRLVDMDVDVLVEDELAHPSLFWLNRRLKAAASYPLIAIVHHLRCLEEDGGSWRRKAHRAIEKTYLRSVDGFIFNSFATMAEVRKLLTNGRPGVVAPPAASHVVGRVTPAEIAERAISDGPLRIVFVGNIIRRKLLHVLVAALRRVSADWRLSIVGSLDVDPAYVGAIRQAVRERALPSRVTLHGSLSDEDLAAVMRQSHVLAMPSAYEGFGIAYLEGMAFGLPAIAGNAGGACEVVTDGYDGFMVTPADPWAIAKRIRRLAEDRDLLTRMGLNALKTYQTRPGWSESFSSVYEFLHISSLLQKDRASTNATS